MARYPGNIRTAYLALAAQTQPIIDAMRSAGDLRAGLVAVNFIDHGPMKRAIRAIWEYNAPRAAEAEYRKLMRYLPKKSGPGFGGFTHDWLAAVNKWLNESGLNKLTIQIDQYTHDLTIKRIMRGIESGENWQDVASDLMNLYNRVRARRIARTESLRAISSGRLAAETKIPFRCNKVWHSAQDVRTRGSKPSDLSNHLLMNQQIADKEGMFHDARVPQVKYLAPGMVVEGSTPIGLKEAAFVVNCRCSMAHVPIRDENGNLVMKEKPISTIPPPTRVVLPPPPPPTPPPPPAPVIKPRKPRAPRKPKPEVPIQPVKPIKPDFVIMTRHEIEKHLSERFEKDMGIKIDSTKFHDSFTDAKAAAYAKTLDSLISEYKASNLVDGSTAKLHFTGSSTTYGSISSYTFSGRIIEMDFGHKTDVGRGNPNRTIGGYCAKSKVDDANVPVATLVHEFAHVLSVKTHLNNDALDPKVKRFWASLKRINREYKEEIRALSSTFTTDPARRLENQTALNMVYLGNYASTNLNEFMAEGFTEYKLNSNPSKYAQKIGKLIDKTFKR